MKTKLSEIVKAFNPRKDGKAVITHVFDSVSDFKRKVELMKNYQELVDIHKMYADERKKLVEDLMKDYAESQGKDPKDYAGQPVPEQVRIDFDLKHEKLLETEVDYTPFKFSAEEVEKAGITISEMNSIIEFMKL